MTETRPRKPWFHRAASPTPLRLTKRDLLILHQVSVHRFLRSDHFVTLVGGSNQHLVRRLGRLYHSGLLDRPLHQRRLQEFPGPLVYCLSERGRKELISQGQPVHASVPRLRKLGSALRLGHDLRIADVLVALESAALGLGHQFHHHHDWNRKDGLTTVQKLHELKWRLWQRDAPRREPRWIIPDAAFSIDYGDERPAFFLLEVDRGTMPVTRTNPKQTSFTQKVEAYRATRTEGHLWKRWNIPGFRVLVVAESPARCRSLQAATANCFSRGTSNMFLFAVAAELIAANDPTREVWQDCAGNPAQLLS